MFGFFVTILAFGFLVFVHELGHFLASLATGVTVGTFSIGMGPVVWSRVIGGVRFQIAALPLGGYVRIIGQGSDEYTELYLEDAKEQKLFPEATMQRLQNKSAWFSRASGWKQLLIVLMGPLCSILLAFPLTTAGYAVLGVPVVSEPPTIVHVATLYETTIEANQKLLPGDVLVGDNQEPLSAHEAQSILQQGQQPLHVQRGTRFLTLPPTKGAYIGVLEMHATHLPFFEQIQASSQKAWESLKLTVTTTYAALSHGNTKDMSGPVGIIRITTQVANTNPAATLVFLGFITGSLGIFNLLPLPGLDGLAAVFALQKMVTGKELPDAWKNGTQIASLVCIAGLILYFTALDVSRLF